jgi:hypothetical protein
MSDVRTDRNFAERLREAVNEETAATVRKGRHKRERPPQPRLSGTANPSRVRYSDELFVDRLRKALD